MCNFANLDVRPMHGLVGGYLRADTRHKTTVRYPGTLLNEAQSADSISSTFRDMYIHIHVEELQEFQDV